MFRAINYIDKKDPKKDDVIIVYSGQNHPKEIEKKITLLGYFKKYLQLEEKEKKFEELYEKNDENNEKIYLKKWRRTNDSILFRLSNKRYQVIFIDKTQVILSSETRTIIYKNTNGEKQIFPISASLKCGNEDIIKKIKYVKELLTSIYTNNIKMINSKQKEKENQIFESKTFICLL